MFIVTEINFGTCEFNGVIKFGTLEEAQKAMQDAYNDIHQDLEDEGYEFQQDNISEYGATIFGELVDTAWYQWDITEV